MQKIHPNLGRFFLPRVSLGVPEQSVAEQPPSIPMALSSVESMDANLPICRLWPECTVRLPLPGVGQVEN